MPEVTSEILADFLMKGPVQTYRLSGLKNTGETTYLGFVGLSNKYEIFDCRHLFAFSGGLCPDSRFTLKRVARGPNEPDVIFVVFRQFDSSKYQSHPEDLIAGWVSAAEESTVQGWIDEMNRRIAYLRLHNEENE